MSNFAELCLALRLVATRASEGRGSGQRGIGRYRSGHEQRPRSLRPDRNIAGSADRRVRIGALTQRMRPVDGAHPPINRRTPLFLVAWRLVPPL
jgi:hypothetical protein